MGGGAMAALLVLAVLLVGVPSMAARRAELGAWQAAGRGEDRVTGDAVRPHVAPGHAAPALRPPGTGLRRSAPGPRVLVRRSSVPRPRCAPGAGSGPVLAGRRRGGAAASTDPSGWGVPPAPLVADPAAVEPTVAAGSREVVRGEIALPRPAADAGAPAPGRARRGAVGRRRAGTARSRRRRTLHLAQLSALALAAVAFGVLAVLGLLPPAAAAVLPGALAVDLLLLRRGTVHRRTARDAARAARVPDAALAAAPRDEDGRPASEPPAAGPSQGQHPPGKQGARGPVSRERGEPVDPPRADGAVQGLPTPLAELRAAAVADAADGLRGPGGAAAEPALPPGADVAGTPPGRTAALTGGRRRRTA